MIQINDIVRLDKFDCDGIVMQIEHKAYAYDYDVYTITYHIINKYNENISAVINYTGKEFLRLVSKKGN